MAEGDSVLRMARRIDGALAGSRVSVRTPGRRRPEGLAASAIDGLVLEGVESRGKHLLLHFSEELTLHSHLGMHGGWHVYRPGQRWRRSASQAWISLAAENAEAVARMRAGDPRTELGEALLDQGLVAGIGNIFKSEGCFAARIDPNVRLESLSDEQLAAVLDSTRALMLEAVESGRQPKRIYRRSGEPCPRCRTRLRSRAQGDDARTTSWCPGCQ